MEVSRLYRPQKAGCAARGSAECELEDLQIAVSMGVPSMNKLAPVFLLLAVALGTFAFYEQHEAATLRARVAELEAAAATERTAASTATAQLEKMQEQAGSQKAVIEQLESRNKELVSNPATPSAAPEGESGAKSEGGGGFMNGIAKMFSDPKMKDVMRSQQAAQVNLMYGSLAQDLGLAPDVARQVLALLGDRQADMAAKGMEAMGKDGKDMAAAGKESGAVKKAYDDQIKALIGEDGFKKFGEYEQSIGDRMALDQMQRQLAAAGTALEPAQQKSVLEIMKEERTRTKTPSATTTDQSEAAKLMQDDASIDRWLVSQQDMNRRVLDRARGVLNADQFVAFEAAQKSFLDMQKMGVQMSREMFKKK